MFLTRPIGAAHLDPNNDALFTGFGGVASASGQVVSPETALRLTVVFACVRTIAEAIGQLPLHVYRRRGRGKEIATAHPLYPVLHRRPNRWQTSAEWRETVAGHLVLRGNSYNEILTSRSGQVLELVPLAPDTVRPVVAADLSAVQYQVKQANGTERTLVAGEVLHLRGLSGNGIVGLNPIEQEREALGYALAAQDYGARFYKNGATMPGWIEHPSNFKTQDDKDRFRAGWREATVGGNRFTTPVLEYGLKYHELALKHTDMQYLETRKYSDVDIARIFRVPPHMVGILDRATWANMEQQSLEFVTHTLMPWLVKMEQAMERSLLSDSEFFIKFSVDGLLRGDARTRAQFYGYGIKDGWLTRNEARELEDRDPLDGLDEPLEPLNMARSGDREWDDGDGAKPKKDVEEDSRGTRGASREALARWVISRIVGREITALKKAVQRGDDRVTAARDFYQQHATHVASALCVPMEAASKYCTRMNALIESGVSDIAPIAVELLEQLANQGEISE